MKHWMLAAAMAASVASSVWAQTPAGNPSHTAGAAQGVAAQNAAAPVLDAHTRQDMERHEAMAKAHSQAAQCLAAGTAYNDCQKQLQTACKGLALGKNCGMRHAH